MFVTRFFFFFFPLPSSLRNAPTDLLLPSMKATSTVISGVRDLGLMLCFLLRLCSDDIIVLVEIIPGASESVSLCPLRVGVAISEGYQMPSGTPIFVISHISGENRVAAADWYYQMH